jgi:hypothetical protein
MRRALGSRAAGSSAALQLCCMPHVVPTSLLDLPFAPFSLPSMAPAWGSSIVPHEQQQQQQVSHAWFCNVACAHMDARVVLQQQLAAGVHEPWQLASARAHCSRGQDGRANSAVAPPLTPPHSWASRQRMVRSRSLCCVPTPCWLHSPPLLEPDKAVV